MKILAISLVIISAIFAWPDHCPLDEAVAAFQKKNLTNPWPYFPNDPYKN